MSRFHRITALVAGVAALGAHAAVASAATNVVANPGFEQGLTGWHPTAGQVKLAAPHSGALSAQVYGATAGQKMSVQPSAYPVTSTAAAEVYTAGAWVYSPRLYAHLCMLLNDRNASGALVYQTSSCLSAQPRTWQHLHISYIVRTPGHSLTLAIQQRDPQAGDWFDVDDVELSSLPLPVNTVAPSITGDPRVKTRLVGNPGTWINGPLTLSYQWARCRFGFGCIASVGNATTYVVTPADAGYTLVFAVDATNANGFSAAASPFTVPAYY